MLIGSGAAEPRWDVTRKGVRDVAAAPGERRHCALPSGAAR